MRKFKKRVVFVMGERKPYALTRFDKPRWVHYSTWETHSLTLCGKKVPDAPAGFQATMNEDQVTCRYCLEEIK